MNREAQLETNRCAIRYWAEAIDQLQHEYGNIKPEKLRSCNAVVYETTDYYILKSYNTLVAVIIKATGILVDMLRREYGYTATSAQHIAKFKHDYTPYPDNHPAMTWRELK